MNARPTRVQVEAAVLVAGVLAILWLYRSYLERSLEAQREYMGDLLEERDRERAATNGSLDPERVAIWLREHPTDFATVTSMMADMASGDPPRPAPPTDPGPIDA